MIVALLTLLEAALVVVAVGWLVGRRPVSAPGRRGGWLRRPGAELVLLALLAAVAPVAVQLGPAPVQVVLRGCALMLVPGAIVLAFWPVRDVLDRLLLTVVLSVTIVLLLSTVMAWTGLWSPALLVHLAAVVGAPVLAVRGMDAMAAGSARPQPSARGGVS